jgi:hypothetical protein
MLAGKDEAVKSDRMIHGFAADALYLPSVSANTARALVLSASQSLKSTFPNLTPRLLDYEIWKFQRSNSTGASVKRAIGRSRPASRKKVRIDEDHHGWLLAQASLLRSGRHDSLDWSNLAEELEAMAAARRRKIKNI